MVKNSIHEAKDRVVFLWRIPTLPVLFLINFIFGLSSSFFAPFSSLFGIDEVGMSNVGFGIFMTITAIGGVVISSNVARLSDTRLSRKKILVISSLTGIVAYTLYAFLRNYYALAMTGFFLLGVTGCAVPQLWAYARESLRLANVPKEDTPFIMNIFRMFFALSWTVGPAIGAWLLHLVGFKGLFLFVASGYLLVFLTVIFFLKDITVHQVSKQRVQSIGKYIKRRNIFAFLAASLLLSAATSIHMLNVPQFVIKVLNGTEMDVGLIFSVPPVFEVPFMILVGIWATKFDNGLLIKIGFFTAFAYFLLFGFVKEPWQIYPLQILSAAQVSITGGIAISYFQDLIPEAPGTATTLYMNANSVGSTLGFLLFGFISELFSYEVLITFYTFCAGVGLLFLILLGKKKPLPVSQELRL
jgi:MFS transporter, SET family, sugar efflux transporter